MSSGLEPANHVESLHRLLALWRERYPKRAFGGVWALTGFSFQAAVFLLKFYRNVIAGLPLSSNEEISDILCPTDGNVHVVIQVKRTLTRSALAAALEEFRLILDLTKEGEFNGLSQAIRFQVVCQHREPAAQWPWPDDAALDDEIRAAIPHIAARAADPFIAESADPFEDLWSLLWVQGVRNPQAVIDRACGRLFAAFGRSEAHSIVRTALVDLLDLAPLREPRERPAGALILADDVRPDVHASQAREIVVGGGFGFRQLQLGCFRPRPHLFHSLWDQFSAWITPLQFPIEGRVLPVFWIDGRSGEGKSVLLRQLIAHLVLQHATRLPVFEVARNDLPRFLGDCRHTRAHPAMVMVDDLYAVADRQTWEDRVRDEIEFELPHVAIVTCGPTEQREEFESIFPEPFRVVRFTVPPFDSGEAREFVDWFNQRVGRSAGTCAETSRDNTLLVQFIFELAEGMTLHEFAERFSRRMESRGAGDAVRRILALKKLYLDAPRCLFSAEEQDTLRRLAEPDQRHFVFGETITFAHAHLASEILPSMLAPAYRSTAHSAETAWIRELGSLMAHATAPSVRTVCRDVVHRLHFTRHLEAPGLRVQALQELYRIQAGYRDPALFKETLPRWLQAMTVVPGLELKPSVVDAAIALLEDPETDGVHPGVVRWLMELAPASGRTVAEIEDLCWRFAMSERSGSAAAYLFGRMQTPDRERRAFEWLRINCRREDAYQLLSRCVATAPDSGEVREFALAWLDANPINPRTYSLLAPLYTARPGDPEVSRRVLAWVTANHSSPTLYWLLAALVAQEPKGEGVFRREALTWLDQNPDHPAGHQLLSPLARAAPGDVGVIERALRWLSAVGDHPQSYQLLSTLVKNNSENLDLRAQSLKWVREHPDHPQSYRLLATLASAAGGEDEEVRRHALEWLQNHSGHPQVFQLLAPLIKAAPADADVRKWAFHWQQRNPDHPHGFWPLAAALAFHAPEDQGIREGLLEWLNRGSREPEAYQFFPPLLNALPHDPSVRRSATDWLAAHKEHPKADLVLSSLIKHAPEEELDEWIARGMAFVKAAKSPKDVSAMMGLILLRGRARPELIAATRGLLAVMSDEDSRYLLPRLSNALARNPANALDYLTRECDFHNVRRVARALAIGLAHAPECYPAFEAAVGRCPPTIQLQALFHLLQLSDVSQFPGFVTLVAATLTRHYRHRDSGLLIRQLKQKGKFWAEAKSKLPKDAVNYLELTSLRD